MTQPPLAYLGRPAHKEPPAHAPNAALLIDFDNVTMAIRSDLQTELKRLLQSEIIRGIEAVKQMTAHNDVMRSDRLKQVMQEIDPGFDEKDVGYSRFSKFVLEAAHKGLINLTKLDNGQYEIGLGPGVPGAAAQPSLAMR